VPAPVSAHDDEVAAIEPVGDYQYLAPDNEPESLDSLIFAALKKRRGRP
jgi:hypothetical protein